MDQHSQATVGAPIGFAGARAHRDDPRRPGENLPAQARRAEKPEVRRLGDRGQLERIKDKGGRGRGRFGTGQGGGPTGRPVHAAHSFEQDDGHGTDDQDERPPPRGGPSPGTGTRAGIDGLLSFHFISSWSPGGARLLMDAPPTRAAGAAPNPPRNVDGAWRGPYRRGIHRSPSGSEMIAEVKERVEAFLRLKGLRMTRQREVIIEAAFGTTNHFTADELWEMARRIDTSTSRATLYRTLALLVESGLLKEIDLGRDQKHYDPNFIEHPHHNHLICLDCDRVVEFEDTHLEVLEDCISRRLGFRPTSKSIRIEARCEELRQRGTCANRRPKAG